MNYIEKLPISDIILINNKDFEHKLNREIIQGLENQNKIANTIKYGLKISDHCPSKILILVYKDIYRIKEGFFKKTILFKEYFNEFESKSKVGKINFDWDNKEKDKIEEFNVYNGNFSAYVLILEKLYLFYFIEEIRREDEYFINILNFLRIKAKEVSTNPFNYFLMDCMHKLILESEFTSIDRKEYVELTLDLISKEMERSKVDVSNNFKNGKKGIFSNDQYEEFFMFLLKVNKKKKNKSFFSTVYRYLKKEQFLAKDFESPRFYFDFLELKDVFKFEPRKIIPSSISSEEKIFTEFDKLYTDFMLQKE